ncbi:MAG: type IV pilus modification protein PilV [Thiomonas sp.]
MRTANDLAPRSRGVCPKPRAAQRGVGLIEILVAAAVLTIGILGIIVLQVKTLADNASSLGRTQAAIAAYSMFDLMRADRANALAGAYNTTVRADDCPTAAATLAQAQLRNWCLGYDGSKDAPADARLRGGLFALGPGASGTVACNPVGPNVTASNCSITLTFNESKATAGQAAQTLTFWTQI